MPSRVTWTGVLAGDRAETHDLGCELLVTRLLDKDILEIAPPNSSCPEDEFLFLDFKQARILRDWITENL